jgi:hypothetical protein
MMETAPPLRRPQGQPRLDSERVRRMRSHLGRLMTSSVISSPVMRRGHVGPPKLSGTGLGSLLVKRCAREQIEHGSTNLWQLSGLLGENHSAEPVGLAEQCK